MLCLRLARIAPRFFAYAIWDRRDSMFCGICFVRLGLLSGSLLERNDAGRGFGPFFIAVQLELQRYKSQTTPVDPFLFLPVRFAIINGAILQ